MIQFDFIMCKSKLRVLSGDTIVEKKSTMTYFLKFVL